LKCSIANIELRGEYFININFIALDYGDNTAECRAVSVQRLGKNVPAATDTHATTVGNGVFYSVRVNGVIRRATEVCIHLII
jgi:hypothetical protein